VIAREPKNDAVIAAAAIDTPARDRSSFTARSCGIERAAGFLERELVALPSFSSASARRGLAGGHNERGVPRVLPTGVPAANLIECPRHLCP